MCVRFYVCVYMCCYETTTFFRYNMLALACSTFTSCVRSPPPSFFFFFFFSSSSSIFLCWRCWFSYVRPFLCLASRRLAFLIEHTRTYISSTARKRPTDGEKEEKKSAWRITCIARPIALHLSLTQLGGQSSSLRKRHIFAQ
jgi:hypothetical protein